MKSTGRFRLLSLLVLPCATGLWAGCERAPADDEAATQVVTSALSTTAAAAFGFESLASWQISSGAATLGSPRTQGQTALQLQSPINYTTITSSALAMTAADIAPLTVAGAHVAVDISLPTQQPNPWWFGATQMFVSCPQRGVYNQYLGQTELTGRRLGNFQTYRFFVPDFVRQQLNGQSCSDFSLTLVINVPSAGTGRYRVDNIRFRTPDDPGSTGTGASVDLVARRAFTPPSSTPGTATFAESRVQVPDSFHVATGRSGTGQLTLLLARTTTDRTTCTYTGADAGTSYRFTSCTRGEQPGELVIATSATLTIVSSDPAGGETKVKAQLAINPTGDELVSGLVPIPTFWGNTAAEVSTISAAYFNRVASSGNLQDGATVTVPTPEIGNRTTTIRTRNLLDPNAPPLSPLDPPFNEYGDVGGSDLANAYWRLQGAVDGAQFGDRFTTHVDANANVHGVLLGIDVEVLRAQLIYDSDSGTVGPTGNTGSSRTGNASVYVFGGQVASVSLDQSVTRTTLFSDSVGFSVPAFTFGIFSINLGMSGTFGVDLETIASFDAIQFQLIPSAVVRGTISGEVNILVASGGIEASVELIRLGLPITARAGWGINTQPAVCAATLQFLVNAVATVSVGAGSVDARVTFGNCGFFGLCHTERWNIVRWGPLLETTFPFVTINETPAVISLPRSACDQPFDMAINCVADNETLASGLPIAFSSTADEPPGQVPPGTGGPGPIIVLPTPIPCAQRTWTTDDPSDTILRQGCEAVIQFGNPGPRTVTMTATNGFQTAAVSKPVVIAALVGGTPVARIINPVQGCLASYLGGRAVPLEGAALDPDAQTPLTFTWDYVPVGSSTPVPIGTGQNVTFNTPLVLTLNATLRLTVTDAGGTSTTVTTPLLVQSVF